jgi:hypothetical protein
MRQRGEISHTEEFKIFYVDTSFLFKKELSMP